VKQLSITKIEFWIQNELAAVFADKKIRGELLARYSASKWREISFVLHEETMLCNEPQVDIWDNDSQGRQEGHTTLQ
jgi:hypothetical protein